MKRRIPKTKQKRGARGEGSIFPDTRTGGWRGKAVVGKYPNGRTRYKWVRGKTQSEVVAKKKMARPPDPRTCTVSEWADRWLAHSGARPSTKGDYAHSIARLIKPTIGPKLLVELTASDVEAAVSAWNLGANTARKNLGQVRAMIEAARKAKLVSENVAKDARPPKAKKVIIKPFTRPELLAIVARAVADEGDSIFAPLATIGCRIGEALALDVTDFDPQTALLSISKTYSRKYGIRRPKSENGIRTVRVPEAALPALRLAIGERASGPLFISTTGTRRAHPRVGERWRKMIRELGFEYRNLHQLRHSVATHALAAGTHIANVARDLGDTPATIIRTYLQATDGPGVSEAMDAFYRIG